MLGITVPDIIAFGVFALSAAAFIYGRRAGDKFAEAKPLEPSTSGIAAGFVDKDLMLRLTMACESIAYTLKELVGIQTDEHERAVNDRLERIEAAVLKKNDDDRRAARSVERTGERVERSLDRTADKITGRKPRD